MTINTFVPMSVSPQPAAAATSTDTFVRVTNSSVAQNTAGVDRLANPVADTSPLSNPAFAYGSRTPSMAQDSVGDPRILRGYIRRSVADDARDPTARYRLNFMFNPTSIDRTFVSYLDQHALDPFNTIFGSGNLVAPPSVLDFSFELFFDRQLEVARDPNHPGVKIDYDYFDRVIRGVEPTGSITDLPDNGVLLINPRNIKVVFSPHLTVEGRPYNASVVYERFAHRMTPTRMRISITLKAQYIGPDTNAFVLNAPGTVDQFQATVPYEESTPEANRRNEANDLTLNSAFVAANGGLVSAAQNALTDGPIGAPGPAIPGNGNASFIWPLAGPIHVNQEYGHNNHPGIDLAATRNTPIYAAKSGIVAGANYDNASTGGYGGLIILDHGGGFQTYYAHQPTGGFTVVLHQQVQQGAMIGHVDSTGHSTGDHLHFEVRKDGATQNPRYYCPPIP